MCIQLTMIRSLLLTKGRPNCAQVLEGAAALALSATLCYAGSRVAGHMGVPGALIPAATGASSLGCLVTAVLPAVTELRG